MCDSGCPEYKLYERLSTKADVYSYGLLILETISGCTLHNYIHNHSDMMPFEYPVSMIMDVYYSMMVDLCVYNVIHTLYIPKYIYILML